MNREGRSFIKIFVTGCLWGTIGLFVKLMEAQGSSSSYTSFLRLFFGALLLAVITLIADGPTAFKIGRKTLISCILLGIVCQGAFNILYSTSVSMNGMAVGSVLLYTAPVFTTAASVLLFREKLTKRKAICAAIAVSGMVLVSGVTEGGGAGTGNLKGVMLGLGAAVCYASVIIMNKKITGVDAYRKTTIQMLCAGLVMVPYMLLTGGIDGAGFTITAVLLLLVVGVIHTGFAYVLYFGSMDGLKAQSIAMLSYIDPVTALLLSALVLREPLSAAGVAGAIMILLSAVISEKRSMNHDPA